MSGSANQRKRLLAVMEMLNSSDEGCPLSANQIVSRLRSVGIDCERRSVYRDIKALIDHGIDIVHTGRGYFIASREIDIAQSFVLNYMISTAGFLSEKKSMELSKAINSIAATDYRFDCVRSGFESEELYYNIVKLSNAATHGLSASFDYVEHRIIHGKIESREHNIEDITPHRIEFVCQKPVVSAYNKSGVEYYRLDRMKNVRIGDKTSCEFRNNSDDFDACTFGTDGKICTAEFICKNDALEYVLERFGRRITMISSGNDSFYFKAKVRSNRSLFSWVFGSNGDVQIIGPMILRKEFASACEVIYNDYRKPPRNCIFI